MNPYIPIVGIIYAQKEQILETPNKYATQWYSARLNAAKTSGSSLVTETNSTVWYTGLVRSRIGMGS